MHSCSSLLKGPAVNDVYWWSSGVYRATDQATRCLLTATPEPERATQSGRIATQTMSPQRQYERRTSVKTCLMTLRILHPGTGASGTWARCWLLDGEPPADDTHLTIQAWSLRYVLAVMSSCWGPVQRAVDIGKRRLRLLPVAAMRRTRDRAALAHGRPRRGGAYRSAVLGKRRLAVKTGTSTWPPVFKARGAPLPV